MDTRQAQLQKKGGKVLLHELQGRATRVAVLSTEFQSLAEALGNEALHHVVQSLWSLVEQNAGRPNYVDAALLDELLAVLDDTELLITKATVPAATRSSDGSELQRTKQELDRILGRLGEFSSWDMADRLKRALVGGSMEARESLLQHGGQVLLGDLEKKATKVDVLHTEFRRLAAALGNRVLLQVVRWLCDLVEYDNGRPQHVHVTLLDKLSAMLDDAEVLITKAAARVAPKPSDSRELQRMKRELDGLIGLLGEFSSWDLADRLRQALMNLHMSTGMPTAMVAAPAGDAMRDGDSVAAGGSAAGTNRRQLGIVCCGPVFSSRHTKQAATRHPGQPRIPEHLRSKVVQHLDDLLPELAAQVKHTPAIGIVGVGGIGKTAVARAVQVMVQHHFDKVVFVRIGQQLDTQQVVASMWKQLFGENPRPMPVKALFEHLVMKLNGMRVLLVLDDVWTAEVLRQLNFVHMLLGSDNCVIVTSRVRGIFIPDDEWRIVEVPALFPVHARELLCWHAFGSRQPPQEYEQVVRGVVTECKGLPLMLEVTGASLKGADVVVWRARLQQLAADRDAEIDTMLRTRLETSTDVLPPLTMRCFALLSMWPVGATVYKQDLVESFVGVCPFQARTTKLWAEEQLSILHSTSLIIDKNSDGSSFTVHDIVRDVAVQESKRRGRLLDSSTLEASGHVYAPARVLRLQRQQARNLSLQAPNAHWLQLEAPSCAKVTIVGDCNRLRLLRLRRCSIRELHGVGVGMPLLRVLDVMCCAELQWLPAAIGSMVNLEGIKLDGCASLQSLPASIGCLRKLQRLSLCGCKSLTALPGTVGALLELEALLLAQCYSLVELPDSVTGLSKLQELDLRCCQSVSALPRQLHVLTKLRMSKLDVRWCAAPVVAQAQRQMPSLGEHKTMHDLFKWAPKFEFAQTSKLYFETEAFVRVLVHLQTGPAARMIVHGGRGEGKSELCDHVFDYFDKVHMRFCAPAFPDGILLLRMQPANGAASSNMSIPWVCLYEQLCAIHRGIFTRFNARSHGPLWCNIVRPRDMAGSEQSGNVRKAVATVKHCIRELLAGRRLLLLIDDAGPVVHHLFSVDGAIPPSFPGACLATVPHPLSPAHLPTGVAVVQMRTECAVCEDIFAREAAWRKKSEVMGEYVAQRLACNPHAVTLLGRLLQDRANASRLLEWEDVDQELGAARGGEAIEPVMVAHAAAISALVFRYGAAGRHFLSALRHFQAGTIVPAAAVAAVCRARAAGVMLEALPRFLKDLCFLLPGNSLEHQHDKALLPEGCFHVGQCLLDAIAAGTTAGGRSSHRALQDEHASSPSDRLVMACVMNVLSNRSEPEIAAESLGSVPAEDGQWLLDWRATFDDLGIHPAWLVQLLELDATQCTARQLLFSAAAGRVWPQLVAEATQLLSSSVSTALGVAPLLLCRNAAGQVLWEAQHTDALLVAIRDPSSKSNKDIVVKLCSALAAREVASADAITIIKLYAQLHHTTEALRDDFNEVTDCQLLCQLHGGQFANVLLGHSRSSEGPVMAHTRGLAALGLHRYDAAVTHLQSAHDAFQREYGPLHAGTIESGAALAHAQLGIGNDVAALQGFRQVEDAIRRALGSRHAAVFMAKADVALALKSTHQLTDALRTGNAALRGLEQQLGSQDPQTIEVMLRCGDTERRLGRLQAASGLCERALSLALCQASAQDSSRCQVPVTAKLLLCIRLGCCALAALGQADRALEVQQLWLHVHRSALGKGHRQTLHLMRDISRSLAQLGRHPEAVSMQFVALRLCREQYGQGDPEALKSMRLLTESLTAMRDLRVAAVVVAAAEPIVAAEFGEASAEAAWWQAQQQRVAAATEHATRQLPTPMEGLMELMAHDTVAYDEDADQLVLKMGHPATTLTNLTTEGIELIGSPAPSRLGAVAEVRITRSTTCDVTLVVSQLPALRLLILEGVQVEAGSARRFADQLSKLTALTGLRCIQNRLGAAGFDLICKVLPSLRQLGDLCVTGNAAGPRGATSLAHVLPSMTHVTALDISSNAVGDNGATALADALCWMDQLLLLGLGGNDISASGIKSLAPSVQVLSKLQALNLRMNRIGSAGAEDLGHALPGLKSLTALDVAHNALGPTGMSAIISKGLKDLVNLQQLDVSDQATRHDETEALGHTLPALIALTGLSIWVAGPAVMRSLTPGLKALTKLKRLDLKGHQMRAEGAQFLADALRALTKLTYLNVQALHGSDGMRESGLKHVAPQLQKLRLLAHLNLGDNAMGVEGVRALACVMPSLTALTYLELCNNDIEAEGAAALGPALTYLSRLADFRLDHDETLDYAGFQPVARALSTLPALVHVAVPDGGKDNT